MTIPEVECSRRKVCIDLRKETGATSGCPGGDGKCPFDDE